MAATTEQPDDLQAIPDAAPLGAEQHPATSAREDKHDMSPVMADARLPQGRPYAAPAPSPDQGSDFAEQRRQGAAPDAHATRNDVGTGQGMGRSGTDGDEDRGYDQQGSYHGGLGGSGGREDLSERQPAPDQNPFIGGQHQPPAAQTQHLGLNTPDPTPTES